MQVAVLAISSSNGLRKSKGGTCGALFFVVGLAVAEAQYVRIPTGCWSSQTKRVLR